MIEKKLIKRLDPINITITTMSNCLIGGNQHSYQIGGIDECTAMNSKKEPIITASSFKGVVRNLFIQESDFVDFTVVTELYEKFFDEMYKQIKNMGTNDNINILEEIESIKNEITVKYLFGVEGYSNSPKLMFSDLCVCDNQEKDYFNIETKNTIKQDINNNEIQLSSNPRTYKTIKQGVLFKGEINFYKFNLFNKIGITDEEIKQVIELVKEQLLKFNSGIYRIGNSKSRGYGKIKLEVE